MRRVGNYHEGSGEPGMQMCGPWERSKVGVRPAPEGRPEP